MEDNIVKLTCKELGITYKELGDLLGVVEGTIKSNAVKSNSEVSDQLIRGINLLVENSKLKNELAKVENLKSLLKDFVK